ncbi:hypothetical protein QYE76_000100 [Lolium multiflorum]|uniref:Jacalin-type lectin domain-containing protein n=1 Tax=Lolium multiflorum TaxID=4521 RepID=A0AAD8VEQ6_LOLMU|nr:hypothetical protein QYE76_000100 [Lolium multiflorum]
MEGSVVRMGPCGGGGGHDRDMDMRGVNRVVKVVVRHGDTVDAISVLYERNGREEWTDLWGGQGGTLAEPDEHFTSVVGHYGEFDGSFAVRSLTFVGNRRSFGPYGQEDGVPFALPAAGGKILGFHARSGRRLDALGTYVKMAADKVPSRRRMADKSAPTTPRS